MARIALIVDDKKTYLRQFTKKHDPWFHENGLEVETKNCAADARKYLKKSGDQVEVIIVDIRLPSAKAAMNLLSFAQENFPMIKKIVMTGQADRDDVGKMGAAGLINGYFGKDKEWPKARVEREIKRVLDERLEPVAHSRITEALLYIEIPDRNLIV